MSFSSECNSKQNPSKAYIRAAGQDTQCLRIELEPQLPTILPFDTVQSVPSEAYSDPIFTDTFKHFVSPKRRCPCTLIYRMGVWCCENSTLTGSVQEQAEEQYLQPYQPPLHHYTLF